MKRYYYTDPLAAAWMADKFGMKLESESLQNYADAGKWNAFFDWAGIEDGPFYIHPDSVALLEPQVWDIVTDGMHYTVHDGNFAFLHDCQTIDWNKIIQRNGVAFMWPEVEE